MNLFVVDPHASDRRGLVTWLEGIAGVNAVGDAASAREAWDHALLLEAEIVLVDPRIEGGEEFISALRGATGAHVIVCSSGGCQENVVAAMQMGAAGCLRKDTLTPDGLAAAVSAAANGSSVVTPEVLGALLRTAPTDGAGSRGARLTDREQQVLSLFAAGHQTREVAQQLCYSERTVKNVLHAVVTKLNARSRSQAVAYAVREGLI